MERSRRQELTHLRSVHTVIPLLTTSGSTLDSETNIEPSTVMIKASLLDENYTLSLLLSGSQTASDSTVALRRSPRMRISNVVPGASKPVLT